MPSPVTISCQIKSKGLDEGFVNGLARYMTEPINFHYGYYKKQVSLFLHNLQVNDYALICGKCVFDNEDMQVNFFSMLFIFLKKTVYTNV